MTRTDRRPRTIVVALGGAALATGLTVVGMGAQADTTASHAPATGAAAVQPAAFKMFDSMVELDGCSGALVRFPRAKDSDKALILTNGHCVRPKAPKGGYVADQPVKGKGTIQRGDNAATAMNVALERLVYATEHGTDIGIYRIPDTYASLKAKGIEPRPMSTEHPKVGAAINVPSSYWQKNFSCTMAKFVYEAREDGHIWKDTIKIEGAKCNTGPGTSGAPFIDPTTGAVIGINNTGNDEGQKCTNNNPCEVDEQGRITYQKGWKYGQQTYQIDSCFKDGTIDLTVPGCRLTGATRPQPIPTPTATATAMPSPAPSDTVPAPGVPGDDWGNPM